MRSIRSLRWGLAAVVAFVPACTLDYQGVLEAAGEGGAGATSAATTDAATTGTTTSTTGSTSTDGSSSSSAGGAGGAADASSSSAGGGGGGGGEGGGPPIAPCPISVSFEAATLQSALSGTTWRADESGDGSLTTNSDRLKVDVDGNGNDTEESAEIRTMDAALFGCSVTVELQTVEISGSVDSSATAYLAAFGEWGPGSPRYEGIEVVVLPENHCEIGSRLQREPDWDGDWVTCELNEPAVFLRLTHTGTALCHEVSMDGGTTFKTLHCRDTEEAYRVAIGAFTVENVNFYFGPAN